MDQQSPTFQVRKARPDEAQTLTELAHAAKSWWGYAAEDIERWRDELTFSAASIHDMPTWVADADGSVIGVIQFRSTPRPEIEHLWVHPSAMRQGAGRGLLNVLKGHAKGCGIEDVLIDADPHAEGFYRRCGAIRIGGTPAATDSEPDRVRPLLLLRTGGSG